MNSSIDKGLKKLNKKRKKCQHVVERETSITCTDTPTKVHFTFIK